MKLLNEDEETLELCCPEPDYTGCGACHNCATLCGTCPYLEICMAMKFGDGNGKEDSGDD